MIIPVREDFMKFTPADIGRMIKSTRKALGITQRRLALLTGTGPRFINELENGKTSCELGKALHVIQALGISISFTPPASDNMNSD